MPQPAEIIQLAVPFVSDGYVRPLQFLFCAAGRLPSMRPTVLPPTFISAVTVDFASSRAILPQGEEAEGELLRAEPATLLELTETCLTISWICGFPDPHPQGHPGRMMSSRISE